MNYIFTYRYCLFAVLAVTFFGYFLTNVLQNPYHRTNVRLGRGARRIGKSHTQTNVTKYMNKTYQLQWNVFHRSQLERPSQVLTFAKDKFGNKLNVLYVVAVLIAVCLAFCGICFGENTFLFVAVTFVLSSFVGFTLVRFHKKQCTRRAQKQFAKFVVQLNKNYTKPKQTVPQKIDKLKTELHDDTLKKAEEILRENKTDEERTVEEQQKINVALNGLLQAYTRAQQS